MEKKINLWVIPTDKPSRLLINKENTLVLTSNYYSSSQPQNIYITSDEEIKEGDAYITKHGEICKSHNGSKILLFNTDKKIILTTNQDLIKEGVQAIDDEFLEWFVKNPSCEEVIVDKEQYHQFVGNTKSPLKPNYKIIIPKEEPKQCDICNMSPRLEGTNKCESCYSVVRYFLEQDPRFKDNLLPDLRKKQETPSVGAEKQIFKIVLDEKWISNKVSIIEADNNSVLNKQETLEEAAVKWIRQPKLITEKESFIAGAKWQAERMYSEEEVLELLKKFAPHIRYNYKELPHTWSQVVKEWFEQFKKK